MSQRSALLVCDLQNAITAYFQDANKLKSLIENSQKAIAHARKLGHLIVYIRVKFRPNFPEVSPNNKMFARLKSFPQSENGSEIIDAVKPQEGDLVVDKVRVGAFSSTNLDLILRAQNINQIILLGISTSGVILSTVRDAADKDYTITVLSDACCDHSDEVHNVLTQKVFSAQATVLTVDEFATNK